MTTIQSASTTSLSAAAAVDSSNPTHASTRMQGGQAVFENDNYRITAGDNNTVNIYNKNTGETYNIWGDPHVNVDGQHAFDFWGTTTFKLEDGTKVTIETTPAGNGMTLASKVAITNGNYGVEISGVDTNKVGDLKINEAAGWGNTLDWVHSDGNVLQENPAGKGFLAVDGNGNIQKVDQNYINKTDLQKNPGGVAEATQKQAGDFARNLLSMFSSVLSVAFSGAFLGSLAKAGEGAEPASRDAHRFSLTVLRLEF